MVRRRDAPSVIVRRLHHDQNAAFASTTVHLGLHWLQPATTTRCSHRINSVHNNYVIHPVPLRRLRYVLHLPLAGFILVLLQLIQVKLILLQLMSWLQHSPLGHNWRVLWKNRIYWYISFFHPSLNRLLFPMFCLLVEGECQILVF